MEQNDIFDLIIIGGGPGGVSAGIYAKRAALKTALLEKGAIGGQLNLTDEVENYPGFAKIGGAELAMAFANHAQAVDLDIITKEVIGLEPGVDFHQIKLSDGELLKTYSIILATGGEPRKLGVPGEDALYGKGVSYCAVCDGFFFRDKTILVVGGGDTAIQEALYLSKVGKKIYVSHRRDKLRASMVLQKRVFEEPKIEMLWNTTVASIKAENEEVNAVDLEDTITNEKKELKTDGVFIFIGFNPGNQLVPEGVKLNLAGHVITDEKCETTIAGIYAIGDLRDTYARQIVTAASDGSIAALAAANYVEMKKSKNS